MPRKRTTILDGFSNPFPTRLRTLLTETKTTQQRLADAIGMKNRQSIGNYCDARAMPDLETFAKIADFFKVSPAWLLGMTDDPTFFQPQQTNWDCLPMRLAACRCCTM